MTASAYHAIIPRTVLDRWGSSEGASPAVWDRIAPLLDRVWDESTAARHAPAIASVTRAAAALAAPGESLPADVLGRCLQVALDATTLSLCQTLGVAASAADRARDLRPADAPEAELACVREGHASGVVRMDGLWALNVARDADAGASELAATAAALRGWRDAPGVKVPKVADTLTGSAPWFDRRPELPVLAVEWLEGAQELHVVRTGTGPRFLRVAAFRHAPRRGPDMLGSLLDREESGRVWQAVAVARTATAIVDWARGELRSPDFEPNDGDVVACPDGTPGLVGASSDPWRGPVAAWPYVLALGSARDDHGPPGSRLRWADPAAAVDAVREGCAARGEPEAAVRMLAAAAELEPERAALLAAGPGSDRGAIGLCSATRGVCAAGAQAEAGPSAAVRPGRSLATP